jgi:hypothetical protein
MTGLPPDIALELQVPAPPCPAWVQMDAAVQAAAVQAAMARRDGMARETMALTPGAKLRAN